MNHPFSAQQSRGRDILSLWLAGMAFTAVHLFFSGRYGFHRDELLSYNNALHLDWCYVVYPPMTAWLARVELLVFGTSLVGFRFLPAVAVGLISVLAGLMARAMGGGKRSMLMAAIATGVAGPISFGGTFFSYMTFDQLCWVAVAWAVTCLLASSDPRWWIAIGAGIGLGLLTKYTILFFAAGLLVGMLLTRNRRYFRSEWFWCGVLLVIALASPVIIWQFQHNFVALAWMQSIHARDVSMGRTDYFIPSQFWRVISPLTVPLLCAGLWLLFATERGKPFRLLAWMYVVPLVLFAIAKGRDYYMAAAYPMLLAAGSVWGESWLVTKTPRTQVAVNRTVWILLVIAAVNTFVVTVPIAPVASAWWRYADRMNDCFNAELGWPEMVNSIAQVRDSLPPEERDGVGVLAGDEGEAGAVNMYGRSYGLPEAISGMNSNWLRGYGNAPPQAVIAVGFKEDDLQEIFASCQPAAQLTNPYGIVNSSLGDRPVIYVCRNIRKPWPEFWKTFQYFG
jgi:4-amino-4-deoxy-L-arabinose transferase and related glycosyltransferases of PMT family